jgi:hypothetical protein
MAGDCLEMPAGCKQEDDQELKMKLHGPKEFVRSLDQNDTKMIAKQGQQRHNRWKLQRSHEHQRLKQPTNHKMVDGCCAGGTATRNRHKNTKDDANDDDDFLRRNWYKMYREEPNNSNAKQGGRRRRWSTTMMIMRQWNTEDTNPTTLTWRH